MLEEFGPQPVLDPRQVPDDACLVVCGNIGAPTVSIEKIPQGREMAEAIVQLQTTLAASLMPWSSLKSVAPIRCTADCRPATGHPDVDADGMGRAFPEIQMSAFVFEGDISAAPYALVDVAHRFAWCHRPPRRSGANVWRATSPSAWAHAAPWPAT